MKNKARTVLSWALYGLAIVVYWANNGPRVQVVFRLYQWLMDKSRDAQRTENGPFRRFE